MANNNILICLERLDIGGVETAVINKAEAFKNKGCNVYVMAKPGVYNDVLESKGIKCFDFEFTLTDNPDFDRINDICEIIKKYNIDQVHIHQFACLPYAGFASINSRIPYNLYIHGSSIIEVYEWYMNCFEIQKLYMKYFFENAYKLIAITHKAASDTQEYFELSKDCFIVEKNSINFNDYVSKSDVTRNK